MRVRPVLCRLSCGHIISARGVAVDPRKIDAIRAWARPVSCTDVRRFVGLSNYYRKFVKGFANLAAPLTSLCSPKAKFRWTAVEQRSFEQLQAALMSAPVLRVWDPARPTRLITDASELAVSAILEQPDDAGAWHPVAYESRKLTAPERAYPPHLLELLAVVHALKVLRPYLLDRPFELHTDNASLQWFQQQRHVTHQKARWLNSLAEFRMTVVHIPGRTNPADFLTRKRFPTGLDPAPSTGYADPESSLELFSLNGSPPSSPPPPGQVFVHRGHAGSDAPSFLHESFTQALASAVDNDSVLGPLAAAARPLPGGLVDSRGHPVPWTTTPMQPSYLWRAGLLFRRSASGDRLCIPSDPELRRLVLTELHATPLGGHFGREKTMALARRMVWWPNMASDVEAFIRTCPVCQRVKAEHGPPAGLLYPLPVPSRRGGTVGLDFLDMPTAASGHDFLQVHIDFLTGRVWLVPTHKTATATTAASNFVGSVFRDVGLPDVLVSDRNTRFTWES